MVDFNDKLTDLFDKLADTLNEAYEIQKSIREESYSQYGNNLSKLVEDISHCEDYYTISDFLDFCFQTM